MADIFISYATADRETAKALVGHLEGLGYSCWWDREISAGKQFRIIIDEEISKAKAVLVLWSTHANESHWVLDEAGEGLEQRKLIPAFIEDVKPSLGFRQIHARVLYDGDSIDQASDFDKLVADLRAKIPDSEQAANSETSVNTPHQTQSENQPPTILSPTQNEIPSISEKTISSPARRNSAALLILGVVAVGVVVSTLLFQMYKRDGGVNNDIAAQQSRQIEALRQQVASLKNTRDELAENEKQLAQARQAGSDFAKLEKQLVSLKKESAVIKDKLKTAEAKLATHKETLIPPAVSTPPQAAKKPLQPTVSNSKYKPGEVFRDKFQDSSGEGPEMVIIPAGRFKMGDIQGHGEKVELPVHEVVIGQPFALSRYEVSFEEYDRFAKAASRELPSDESWGRGSRPVINVSWGDAQAYAQWLTEKTGHQYRLPSEAEWEYAARAGTKTDFWWGDDIGKNNANCDGCGSQWDNKQTAPVDSFKSNGFGLYDTVGNVWEWVQDCNHYDYNNYNNGPKDGSAWESENCGLRVLRGGSWYDGPQDVRSSNRDWITPDIRNFGVGFRLARKL
jgi:formylglycine-generating enzyme required for sulfatase activity